MAAWVWVVSLVMVAGMSSKKTESSLLTEAAVTMEEADLLPAMPSVTDLMGDPEERPLNTLADLDGYVADLQDKARMILAKTFAARLRRRRRELGIMSVNVSGTEPHNFGFSTEAYPVTAFHILQSPDTSYFILGTYRNREQRVVELGGPEMRQKDFILDPNSSLPVAKIAAVLHQGFLWMVFGTAYINSVVVGCMNQANFEAAVPQSLPVHELGALHFFSAGKNLYLVVGEQQLGSAIYKLERKKYFDQMEDVRLRTSHVKAITSFADGNAYYIVFGMASEGGSQVYKFDVLTETVQLVQELQDRKVQGAHQFLDLHDNKRYLALLNTNEALRIYWWNRDQLQEWQTLRSPRIGPSTSLALVPLSNLENILCLAHKGNLIFYTDDLTGHYIVNFVARTKCSNVYNLQALRMEQEYVVAYLCDSGATGSLTLQGRRLLLSERLLVQTGTRTDELLACLQDVSTALEARENDITLLNDYLATRPPKPDDGSQIWRGPVTFSQGLTVTGTTTFQETLTLQAPREDLLTPDSFPLVRSRLEALQESVKVMVNNSNFVLYYSEDQSFSGPVTALSLRVDAAHFGTLQIDKLNGLEVANLERKVLLIGAEQHIDAPLVLQSLTAHTVTTHTPQATLNGIRTADLMRKSAQHQVVSGEHTYMNMRVGGNIVLHPSSDHEFSINGVPISTIVTKGSSVTFLARKTIKNLVVISGVNVRLVNGVRLRSVADQVVYTDVAQPQTLGGAVKLTSMEVAGDVDVVLINGVNLRQLNANTVKITGDFALQGPVRYMNSLRIAGNLRSPVVNGVDWDRLLDRQSPNEQVLSNFSFTSAFVSHDVISNDINGLDLSEDVVLVNTTQTIDGRITFKSNVTVTGPEGVLMDEGVTINNVDISSLLDNVEGIGKLIVSDPVTFNEPLTCSGDITAVNINDLPLEGIENRYWRKSVPQVIDVPVKLGHVEFLEAVMAGSLNGLQITDFLTYDTPQQIIGTYEFRSPVKVTGHLQLGVGSTVNGVDVVALNKSVVTLHGDQTIAGSLEGGRVTVGHLDLLGTLNGVDPRTGYLRLDRTLQHSDKLTFLGKTVAAQMTLAGNLRVDTLNGLRVEKAARELVLQDQDATIPGPHTLHLAANTTVVHLDVGGTLDGVDLNDLLSSALLKTPSPGTLQEVTGRLRVAGAIHFANSLSLNFANDKHFTSHLQNVVSRDYDGLIRGKKTFLEPVAVLAHLDATTVNGLDLREFASHVFTKMGDQVINAHYTFASPVTIEHLSTPTINNITMSQVLLVDTPGHLAGITTFLAPLTIRGHLKSSSTTLAGCDLSRLTDMSLERASDGSLHVYGPLRVEHLYVNGTLESPTGVRVGDLVNLDTFLGSLVLKSKSQTIYGNVEFLSRVQVQLMTAKTINNVDVTEMFSQSVQYNEEENIRCNLNFEHPIKVVRLLVKGPAVDSSGRGLLVGGVNVSWVAAEAVRDQGNDIVITGHKTFANGFTSYNLIINGLLDGVPVRDFVTLGDGQMMQAATFLKPLRVSGNLKVKGLIDGVDLDHVFTSRVNLLKPEKVSGSCSFHAVRVLGSLDVEVINDVVLSDLVVQEGQSLQVVEGPKTFAGGLVVQGAINTSLLNGVDVVAMNRSLLRLDKPAVITNSVRFTSVVVAERAVGGDVQGHDARNLSHHLDKFVTTSTSQYSSLLDLHRSIHTRVAANLATAKNMFVMLHYLGWNYSHPLPARFLRHELSTFLSEDVGTLLVVKECGDTCVCPTGTSFYKVWEDGSRTPDLFFNSSGSLFFLSAASLNLVVMLQVTCGGGRSGGTLTVRGAAGEHTFPTELWSLGVVADASIFVDNNNAYVVTAGRLQEATNVTQAWVVVMRVSFDHRRVDRVWGYSSPRNAAKLDLTQVGSTWYLLVVYEMDPHKMDRYSTATTLFVWSSQEEEFKLQRKYIGHRVSSAMFMKVRQPSEEHFFVLAQRRAATHHADTRVLVYKHDEKTDMFEEFQVLPISDVVSQAALEVGSSPYLLLLSEEEHLDVYRYIPLEGFRLQQSVGVRGPVSMAVVEGMSGGQQVWVSTEAPARLQVFRVWHKGIDPTKL